MLDNFKDSMEDKLNIAPHRLATETDAAYAARMKAWTDARNAHAAAEKVEDSPGQKAAGEAAENAADAASKKARG